MPAARRTDLGARHRPADIVTQYVDGNKCVHLLLRKSML